jgi:colanic acid biosynthesis glycosyl transferase WcaI
VLRLPLWIGRATAGQRIRQEISFMLSQFGALPFLHRPDVLVSVSPSFPALLPGVVNVRARGLPWVLWLHDILPDGAVAAGVMQGGPILKASRWLERAAYRGATKIVVLSQPFLDNLRAKGVPAGKLHLIYDPATREPHHQLDRVTGEAPRVLSMGNIGYTQGLAPLAAAFDRSAEMRELGAKLIVTGDGVAAGEVKEAGTGGNVEMLGVVSDDRLEHELRSASLALVSQSYEGTEFNLPSKLMNFMAYGLPIIAAVNPKSEVARIVNDAAAGWVADSSNPELFPRAVQQALSEPSEMARRSAAAAAYASEHFSREQFGRQFELVLREAVTTQSASS